MTIKYQVCCCRLSDHCRHSRSGIDYVFLFVIKTYRPPLILYRYVLYVFCKTLLVLQFLVRRRNCVEFTLNFLLQKQKHFIWTLMYVNSKCIFKTDAYFYVCGWKNRWITRSGIYLNVKLNFWLIFLNTRINENTLETEL